MLFKKLFKFLKIGNLQHPNASKEDIRQKTKHSISLCVLNTVADEV